MKSPAISDHVEFDLNIGYSTALEPELSDAERNALRKGLVAFSDHFSPLRHDAPVNAVLRDAAGFLCGGLVGSTLWDWLQVDILWVHDSLRRRGLGSRLLHLAEAHAYSLGCRYSRLSSFDYDARNFCERQGYKVYGELPDFPAGHTQFHFRKSLAG